MYVYIYIYKVVFFRGAAAEARAQRRASCRSHLQPNSTCTKEPYPEAPKKLRGSAPEITKMSLAVQFGGGVDFSP